MSRENVEVVRQMWETLMSGDSTVLPVAFLDPDVVFEDEMFPDHAGETYRGRDGMQRAWTRVLEPVEDDFEVDIVWARDMGDAVVTCHHVRARGKGSGIELEFDMAYLWRLRDGKVAYCKSFRTPDDALEAAGLEE